MKLNKKKFAMILLLGVPILTVGFLFTYWTQNKTEPTAVVETAPTVEEPSETVSPPKPKEEKSGVTQEDLDKSKIVAEQFVKAISNYDAQNPLESVDNAKPHMTKMFAYEWSVEPPRRPLALSRSIVTAVETYPVELPNPYAIAWNVVVTTEQTNPLGDIVMLEEWFWILMDKEDGEWKVEEVDVTYG